MHTPTPPDDIEPLLGTTQSLLSQPGVRAWPELGLKLMWSEAVEPPGSVLQQPACLFVLQGTKVLMHRKRRWHARKGDALVVNMPMMVMCDTAEIDDTPLVAVSVDLDMGMLVDLHAQGCPPSALRRQPTRIEDGLHLARAEERTLAVLRHLLDILDDELAVRVLGAALLRELHFWLLRSSLGQPLHRLMQDRQRLAAVARAVQLLRNHPENTPAMEDLARELAMSPSTFYAVFSQVMGTSPLQYLKTLRLHRARQLLRQGGVRVHEVATQVGYSSTSQFSREFQRAFGVSPSVAAKEPDSR